MLRSVAEESLIVVRDGFEVFGFRGEDRFGLLLKQDRFTTGKEMLILQDCKKI